VDKDDDLGNEVGIQMNKFNLKGVEESAEEITGWEHKSPLKEGLRYHYFSSDRESPHPLLTAIGEWHKGGGGGSWSATSLWISSSSTEEVSNISSHEAAMDAKEKIIGGECENENGDRSKNGG
jgi:hypothetical protein